MSKFKAVPSTVDFPSLEREILDYWYTSGVVEKYLKRNEASDKQFSFLDGPITANNPMGVHHAWGRTYKDLWQRFFNMKGYKQRFQNGFDEQGLWVEVEVEKELGLKSKKDIENLVPGDKFASLEKFVSLCKERVEKFSKIQTEQSKRLGYFMDWGNSYHTSSDRNNYSIWHFLKVVNQRGWLYKGHDSVPWCPRCGTAISQHEILTEEYKELEHESVYFKLAIKGRDDEYLLVWTTTPWTIPANVAVAVAADEDYVKVPLGREFVWVMKKAVGRLVEEGVLEKDEDKSEKEVLSGSALLGWEYIGAFDNLERVKNAMGEVSHQVVVGDKLILPVSSEEGVGMVHIAPGAGSEDFRLGQKEKLPVIELIDEEANYMDGMGEFSGKNAKASPRIIIDYLKSFEGGKFLLKTVRYMHRYPTCWRCKSELVWRVVDEWYIAMDRQDSSGKTYREQMIEVAKKITWMPKWGLERELDWLSNMHDWLISKKRYWGLCLPIWECSKCSQFEVVGGREELQEKVALGWEKFEGHSPHRPWVDEVAIKCGNCGELASRIPDVGNPWLDAGIVPFSTMDESWFPADFITESFPGQFKNWFYSLIAMTAALKGENPTRNLLGYASVVDEKGEEMHKSKGNSIEFNQAADQAGVDVMRWLYLSANPEQNLKFGFNTIADVKRRFYLILWNSYKFFVEYAGASGWWCDMERGELTVMDRWVLSRLTQVVLEVNKDLEKFDASSASRIIEEFVVEDLSTWYVRRIRDRVTVFADGKDRNLVLSVLFGSLVTLSKLTAPFMPFITEAIYRNLWSDEQSVHLSDYPLGDKSLLDRELMESMKMVRKICERGHSLRKEGGIKLRQPLASVQYGLAERLSPELEEVVASELNVKEVIFTKSSDLAVELDTKVSEKLREEGEARDLIRQVQVLRKEGGLKVGDKLGGIKAPSWPKQFEGLILKSTNSLKITKHTSLEIVV